MAETADTSVLLDLVRQYGDEMARTYGNDMSDDNTEDLFDRIAALVPQHPVQARDGSGKPWWLHSCGWLSGFDQFEPPKSGRECDSCWDVDGPWRPLLVGGDPAPKPPADTSWIKTTDGPNEPSWQEVGDHFLMEALGVERLDEVMPAIERLKAAVSEEIEARDENHEWADRLAQAIAEFLHIDIGEHSNMNLPWQAALIALTDAVSPAQPDPSDPLVLTLPQVPEGATLQGGARWLPSPDGPPGAWVMEGGSVPYFLGRLLDAENGSVTVELAPPREPRTWPALNDAPLTDELPDVVDVAGHGRWKLGRERRWYYSDEGEERAAFAELREYGPVTEVFEA